MNTRIAFALFALAVVTPAHAAEPVQWSATGTLLEACTCAVPCSCNFGEPPSPHHYCHAVYAYRLDKAVWGGVDLSGLTIAGADGPRGGAAFLDERATAKQRPALKALTRAVWSQGGPANAPDMPFVFAKIATSVVGKNVSLTVGEHGGFAATIITGRDGKSPVVVENNTVWPVPRAIKGKTAMLTMRHPATGAIKTSGTNANYGAFTMQGTAQETANIREAAKARTPVSSTGCCAAKKAK